MFGKGLYGIKDAHGNVITIDGKKLMVRLRDNGIYLVSHDLTVNKKVIGD